MWRFRFPIPFGRSYQYRVLPRVLSKRFRICEVRSGNPTFLALDCSPSELKEVRFISDAQVEQCFTQLSCWCRPKRATPAIRVCFLGRLAPISCLPRSLRCCLALPHIRGCWDNETQTACVKFDASFPVLQNTMHEMTHAWIGLHTNHWPFPGVLEEGFARAIERMFGFDPPGCDTLGWSDPAANLQRQSDFFSIKDLLSRTSPFEHFDWSESVKTRAWLAFWESDALLAYLVNRLGGENRLLGIFNRLYGCWLSSSARLKKIAELCSLSTIALEDDFRSYALSTAWKPLSATIPPTAAPGFERCVSTARLGSQSN